MPITQRGQLTRDDSNTPVGWNYAHIALVAPTTTVVKATPGVLHSLCINTPAATGVVTIYDNTEGSGTVVGIITMPETLLSNGPHLVLYDVAFDAGLTIVTSVAAQDITVSYI